MKDETGAGALLWWRVGAMFAWTTFASLLVFHGADAIFGSDYDRWAHVVRAGTLFALIVPAVVATTRLLDRAPLSGIGLTSLRHGGRHLLAGAACWLIPAAAGSAACLLLGWTEVALRGSVGEMLLTAGGLLVLVFFYEAFPEELVFRGYLFSRLAARWGPWPAILAQAALFTLWGAVNGGANSMSRIALFFAFSLVTGLLRAVTGSVWTSIGFHLAFQTAAQLFGSVGGQFELTSPSALTVVAFGALPFAAALTVRSWWRRQPVEPTARPAGRELEIKGVNYDVGTAYVPGHLSRPRWNEEEVREDIRVIAEELHCNAVTVFGSEAGRLAVAARHAAEQGLRVWLQPRLVESGPAETLAHLREVSVIAEELRLRYPDRISLNVGCELSLFMRGIVPGRTFERRTQVLTLTWPLLLWRYNRKLNEHLGEAVTVAREHFQGDVTYAAGSWEILDWRPFDLVGVNLYRDASNQAGYLRDLRALRRHGRPVVITEFGCCAHEGADAKGASGDGIVDWRAATPRVKGAQVRSEQVQADYLAALIETYAAEDVHGAFVFEFAEPSYPHSPDPRHDLDMASFGIVKVCSRDGRWERKAAFSRVADLYRSL